MAEYREQVKERLGAAPVVANVTNPVRSTTLGYMSLAEAYGWKDMQIGVSDDIEGQTVEQKFQAYVTAALLKPGTNSLKFWEVSNAI